MEESSLEGAKVTFDNPSKKFHYETEIHGILKVPDLPAGNYTITIEKEGYETYIKQYKLGKYEHLRLDVDLIPSKKPAKKEEKPVKPKKTATKSKKITKKTKK